jgi:hypothetical protein
VPALSVPECARLMNLTVEEAASRVMGMPPHELTCIEEVDGGYLIETHDGYLTLIRDDGSKQFGASRAELGLADQPEPDYELDDDDQAQDVDLPVGYNAQGVPDGTAQDVMEWVHSTDDEQETAERAKVALRAESASGFPRKTLLAALRRISPPPEEP